MAKKHTHRFERVKIGNRLVYRCTLPTCTTYYEENQKALLVGKESICNHCGEKFILSKYALTLAKPHCEECHQSKKETVNKIKDLIATMNDRFIKNE